MCDTSILIPLLPRSGYIGSESLQFHNKLNKIILLVSSQEFVLVDLIDTEKPS